MTTNLHAHIDADLLDCDGPLYHSRVETLTDEERAEAARTCPRHGGTWGDDPTCEDCTFEDGTERPFGPQDFHDYRFKERVLGNIVSFHAEGATVTITPGGFYYSEPTEEGHRAYDVRWCEDTDCDPNARSYRDVYAEQMGY